MQRSKLTATKFDPDKAFRKVEKKYKLTDEHCVSTTGMCYLILFPPEVREEVYSRLSRDGKKFPSPWDIHGQVRCSGYCGTLEVKVEMYGHGNYHIVKCEGAKWHYDQLLDLDKDGRVAGIPKDDNESEGGDDNESTQDEDEAIPPNVGEFVEYTGKQSTKEYNEEKDRLQRTTEEKRERAMKALRMKTDTRRKPSDSKNASTKFEKERRGTSNFERKFDHGRNKMTYDMYEYIRGSAEQTGQFERDRRSTAEAIEDGITTAADGFGEVFELGKEIGRLGWNLAETLTDGTSEILTGSALTEERRLKDIDSKGYFTLNLKKRPYDAIEEMFLDCESYHRPGDRDEDVELGSSRIGKIYWQGCGREAFLRCFGRWRVQVTKELRDIYSDGKHCEWIMPWELLVLTTSWNFAILDKTSNTVYANENTFRKDSGRYIVVDEDYVGYTDWINTGSFEFVSIRIRVAPVLYCERGCDGNRLGIIPDDYLRDNDLTNFKGEGNRKKTETRTQQVIDAGSGLIQKPVENIKNVKEIVREGADSFISVAASTLNRYLPGTVITVRPRPQLVLNKFNDADSIGIGSRLEHTSKDKQMILDLQTKKIRPSSTRFQFDTNRAKVSVRKLDRVRHLFDELGVNGLRRRCDIYQKKITGDIITPYEMMAISCCVNMVLYDLEDNNLYVNEDTRHRSYAPINILFHKGSIGVCNELDVSNLSLLGMQEWEKYCGVEPGLLAKL